jgi:transcriptional regulator with XRE-family HTH domain
MSAMKPAEYLDAAIKTLNLPSSYALAKKMNIPRGHLQEIRTGKRAVPLSAAYWLAITLELDPAELVADLEAQREKNPERKAFWKSFLSHARRNVLLACMLALSFSAGHGSGQGATGGAFNRRRQFA